MMGKSSTRPTWKTLAVASISFAAVLDVAGARVIDINAQGANGLREQVQNQVKNMLVPISSQKLPDASQTVPQNIEPKVGNMLNGGDVGEIQFLTPATSESKGTDMESDLNSKADVDMRTRPLQLQDSDMEDSMRNNTRPSDMDGKGFMRGDSVDNKMDTGMSHGDGRDGNTMDSKMMDNKMVDEKMMDGKKMDDKNIDSKMVDDKMVDNKMMDNNKIMDGKKTDTKMVDEKMMDNKMNDANMNDANVTDANMKQVNDKERNGNDVDFSRPGTGTKGMDMQDSNRSNMDTKGPDMKESEMERPDMMDTTRPVTGDSPMHKPDVQIPDAKDSNMMDMNMNDTMKDTTMKDTNMTDSKMKDTNMKDAHMRDSDMKETNMKDSKMKDPNMKETQMKDSNTKDFEMRKPDMKDSDKNQPGMKDSNMRDSDVRKPDMKDSDMRQPDSKDSNMEDGQMNNTNTKDRNSNDKNTKDKNTEDKNVDDKSMNDKNADDKSTKDSGMDKTNPDVKRPFIPDPKKPTMPDVKRPEMPDVKRPEMPDVKRPNVPGDGKTSTDEERGRIGRKSLWLPKVGATWQIVLRGAIDIRKMTSPNVEVWDIDAYENSAATIKQLQAQGKKVICYFSAGTYENYREDRNLFKQSDLGEVLEGWPDERWIKLSSPTVRSIMAKRIKTAAAKGCDAIDPDNVDGYSNKNGLGLTKNDTIDFMKFLTKEARSYNMSTGLKNAGDVIDPLLTTVDFAVNEQCVEFSECATFSKFIKANKPVFHIEYPAGAPWIGSAVAKGIFSRRGKANGSEGFSTVVKKLNLDGWVRYFDGSVANTMMG